MKQLWNDRSILHRVILVCFAAVMAMTILFVRKNMKGQSLVAAMGSEKVEKSVLLLFPTTVYYVFTAISSPWSADRYEMAIIPDMFMSQHHPYWTYVKTEKIADFLNEKSGDYSSLVLYINKICDPDSILDEFAQKGFNLKKCEFEKDFFYVYATE